MTPDSKNNRFNANSLELMIKSDAKLVADKEHVDTLVKKYFQPATPEVFERTVKALRKNGFAVHVVDSGEEALAKATSLITDGSTVSMGGSTTLAEIGFVDWLKAPPASAPKFRNTKGEAVAARLKGDLPGFARLTQEGMGADWFFSSLGGISEQGEIVWGSGTGTRVSTHAKNLVLVAGSQKITHTYSDAVARLYEFQKTINDANVRKAYGIESAPVQDFGAMHTASPVFPGRVTIVLIRNGTWGY